MYKFNTRKIRKVIATSGSVCAFLLSILIIYCFVIELCFFSHRFSIKGRVYPAILPVENKNVVGRVCFTVRRSFASSNFNGGFYILANDFIWNYQGALLASARISNL